jgi:hypothetical protein
MALTGTSGFFVPMDMALRPVRRSKAARSITKPDDPNGIACIPGLLRANDRGCWVGGRYGIAY